MITQNSLAAHHFVQILQAVGGVVELGRNVDFEEFVAIMVAEHANQGVVNLDKTAGRDGEEEAFLNVVEQFAITSLGLTPVGDVLENVNGVLTITIGAV